MKQHNDQTRLSPHEEYLTNLLQVFDEATGSRQEMLGREFLEKVEELYPGRVAELGLAIGLAYGRD